MAIGDKILKIVFIFLFVFSTHGSISYGQNSLNSIKYDCYSELNDYLDIYYMYYHSYPSNINDLVEFIYSYNGGVINEYAYLGNSIAETISFINSKKSQITSIKEDDRFSLYDMNGEMIYTITKSKEDFLFFL